VPDESHSEQLRRESDELLATAAKLIEHVKTLKTQAAELQKQIARLQSSDLETDQKESLVTSPVACATVPQKSPPS
jgi:precorrin-4 methylase